MPCICYSLKCSFWNSVSQFEWCFWSACFLLAILTKRWEFYCPSKWRNILFFGAHNLQAKWHNIRRSTFPTKGDLHLLVAASELALYEKHKAVIFLQMYFKRRSSHFLEWFIWAYIKSHTFFLLTFATMASNGSLVGRSGTVITSYTIILWVQFSWLIYVWTHINFRMIVRRLRSNS